MYIYGFHKYAGVDKVWKSDLDNKTGDLLQISDDFYLSLGEDVSFAEQYVYGLKSDISKIKLVEKGLLNKQTLKLLHRMVYQRYSTYKNVLKLFLPQEIDKLINKKISKKLAKNKTKQTLMIYPDLRTLINFTTLELRETVGVDTLISSNTQNQKDISRRNIKNGNTHTILATHSEIFQNYKNLSKIIMIQPHKRYYANQQDPRYKTLEVAQKLADIWDCELVFLEHH